LSWAEINPTRPVSFHGRHFSQPRQRLVAAKLKQLAREVRTALRGGLIPPEIRDDEFYALISTIAANPDVRTILEIGASSGEGSTEALIQGARRNPSQPVIDSIEVSPPRFRALASRHRKVHFLRTHNVSSVSIERFATEEQVRDFHHAVDSPLRSEPLDVVLGWLRADIETVQKNNLSQDGVRVIKTQAGIDTFDMVLIDGSEFTGSAELEDVYGAKFILLDDICTFKNFDNHLRLSNDEDYVLVQKSDRLRNGYAAFRRRTEKSS
jgi:hypothetical protein